MTVVTIKLSLIGVPICLPRLTPLHHVELDVMFAECPVPLTSLPVFNFKNQMGMFPKGMKPSVPRFIQPWLQPLPAVRETIYP